jgi:hypothetical protein
MTTALAVATVALLIAIQAAAVLLYVLNLWREERAANRLIVTGLLEAAARERREVLNAWQLERVALHDQHRSETRELLNRLYHPEAMPVATTPARPPHPNLNASARARQEWATVGQASPIRPVRPLAPDDDELEVP